jgi:hypothetical protein
MLPNPRNSSANFGEVILSEQRISGYHTSFRSLFGVFVTILRVNGSRYEEPFMRSEELHPRQFHFLFTSDARGQGTGIMNVNRQLVRGR